MRKKRAAVTFFLMVILLLGMWSYQPVHAASKYVIYVNRRSNIVNVVRRKSGKVIRSMYCSTGRGYATPAGTFFIGEKYRWHTLYQGHVGQYCSRITGHILFHSVPAVAWSNKAVPTKAFNQLGSQASLGCVRLACGDACWIYRYCRSGTKVIIGERRKLKKPKYSRIIMSTKKKNNWDPTDPSKKNPYRPVLKKSEEGKKAIAFGSVIDIKKLVKVKSQVTSTELLQKNIKAKGRINTKKAGKYKVKVTVRDPRTRLSRTKTFTFTVAKEQAAAPAPTAAKGQPAVKDQTTKAEDLKKAEAAVKEKSSGKEIKKDGKAVKTKPAKKEEKKKAETKPAKKGEKKKAETKSAKKKQ